MSPHRNQVIDTPVGGLEDRVIWLAGFELSPELDPSFFLERGEELLHLLRDSSVRILAQGRGGVDDAFERRSWPDVARRRPDVQYLNGGAKLLRDRHCILQRGVRARRKINWHQNPLERRHRALLSCLFEKQERSQCEGPFWAPGTI